MQRETVKKEKQEKQAKKYEEAVEALQRLKIHVLSPSANWLSELMKLPIDARILDAALDSSKGNKCLKTTLRSYYIHRNYDTTLFNLLKL